MFVFNTLAPVFLLIVLGGALLRAGFLTPELSKGINRLAYWVALPALLFQSTASAGPMSGGGRLVLVMIGALLLVTLLGIGASLMTVPIRGQRQTALLASALKLAVMPLLGWALGRWLGLDRMELLLALVYLGCPTGASSFTVVAEMGGDEPMASTTIVLSTLLSAATLALIVASY